MRYAAYKDASAKDASNQTCPGCREPFKDGDITGMLQPPADRDRLAASTRWHLHCHQKAYYKVVGG